MNEKKKRSKALKQFLNYLYMGLFWIAIFLVAVGSIALGIKTLMEMFS